MRGLAIVAMLAGACSKTNPYYCAGHPDNNCAIDGAMSADVAAGCQSSNECSGDTPVCLAPQCVQCTTTMAAACTDQTPICGSDNTCHGCAMESDCASQVCLPDGSCADQSTVLYASPTGGATSACTVADKCSIEQAVSLITATDATIHLDSGTYSLNGTVMPTASVTIVGRGATLNKVGGTHGPTVSTSPNTTLTIDYATIEGGDDPNSGHGVSCDNATVIVHDATLQNNAAMGVGAIACAVVISQSMFAGNNGGGISITGSGSTFDVTNNFIVRNGTPTGASVGGIQISISGGPGTGRFQFNTIVDNMAESGVANTGGVFCDFTGYDASNNIIARNTIDQLATPTNAQTLGACTYPTSLVQDDTGGIAFTHADSPPFTYDLQIGSTAIDMALSLSTIDVDYHGNFRPSGPAKDIGADEFLQ